MVTAEASEEDEKELAQQAETKKGKEEKKD